MCAYVISRVRLFVTPWTVTYQALQSMGFSRQEYWNGLPFSSPGDLPNPGIESGSPALQTDALPSEPLGKPLCAYLTYMQSTSWETLGGKKHKLKSRLPGEISITSDILVAQTVKRLPAMWETQVWFLGREDPPGEGNGNPLQHSCLENPMDGGAW